MRTLRKAFDAAAHDLPAAERLADAYIDYGRQVGDAHYAGYAEAVIAPWVQAAAPPAAALVTAGHDLTIPASVQRCTRPCCRKPSNWIRGMLKLG